MPTGYTQIFGEREVEFPEFASRCARAMGPCVMLRDEPLSGELPDEISDDFSANYYRKKVHSTEMQISRLRKAKPNQLRSKMLRELKTTAVYSVQERQRALQLKNRYAKMLQDVAAWKPPTEDHIEFKKFMVQQLVDSAKHDCETEYYDRRDAEVLQILGTMTPEQWRDEKLIELQQSLEYYRKEMKKEKEHRERSNAWIQALKASLSEE